MRFYLKHIGGARRSGSSISGMTLVEVMVALSLMLMVLAAIVAANLIGLKENAFLSSKAGASNTSRRAVNTMLSDIRMAKGYEIGNAATTNYTTLVAITNGFIQGTALQLYPVLIATNESIDYTKYIQYTFDLTQTNNSDGILYRYCSTNNTTTVVASNLINSLYFLSENYTGSNQWSSTYKTVIHTTLQFCEFQYPMTKVGSNYLFDYYRIDCRATPHLPDGP
jgi:Tfp pilus assembly protein PilW